MLLLSCHACFSFYLYVIVGRTLSFSVDVSTYLHHHHHSFLPLFLPTFSPALPQPACLLPASSCMPAFSCHLPPCPSLPFLSASNILMKWWVLLLILQFFSYSSGMGRQNRQFPRPLPACILLVTKLLLPRWGGTPLLLCHHPAPIFVCHDTPAARHASFSHFCPTLCNTCLLDTYLPALEKG